MALGNPFLNRTAAYVRGAPGRGPGGDVEDIALQYKAGVRTWLFTMHHTDFDYRPWQTLINRINPYPDAVWLPWAYLWRDSDCMRLRKAAQEAFSAQYQKLDRPAACWNAEKQWDQGVVTTESLIASATGCDVLLSTEPSAFHNVPWALLPPRFIVDAQLFPLENADSGDPRGVRSGFYRRGFRGRVHFQHGVSPALGPWDFPWAEPGRYSVYCMEDAMPPGRWMPRPLAPLSEVEFPYRGPLVRGQEHPQIPRIKHALHRAGYQDFASEPTVLFNDLLETAVRRFQFDKGIPATGRYGQRTWQALRVLASANRGGERYALLR